MLLLIQHLSIESMADSFALALFPEVSTDQVESVRATKCWVCNGKKSDCIACNGEGTLSNDILQRRSDEQERPDSYRLKRFLEERANPTGDASTGPHAGLQSANAINPQPVESAERSANT